MTRYRIAPPSRTILFLNERMYFDINSTLIYSSLLLLIASCCYFFQQWATFARMWHIYDAKWQCPFQSAPVLIKYLTGQSKPIYHPLSKYELSYLLWRVSIQAIGWNFCQLVCLVCMFFAFCVIKLDKMLYAFQVMLVTTLLCSILKK